MKITNACLPYKLLICFFLGVEILGCKKDTVTGEPGAITSFRLEAVHNGQWLSKDILGIINGTTIKLSIPDQVPVNSLVVSFVYSGKEITVAGIAQQSGITANNFEQQVIYSIKGNNGDIVQFTINIEKYSENGLDISEYSILKNNNILLASDVNFIIRNDSILATIPPTGGKSFIPSFSSSATTVLINGVQQQSGTTVADFSTPFRLTLVSVNGFKKNYIVHVVWKYKLPHIYINTAGNAPIVSKDDYLNATIRIEGNGVYPDFENTTRIRGRGNSTWNFPKKPYRLKLDEDASLLGLLPEKDWVLLANYIDGSLMLIRIALIIGELMNMSYVNHLIPVDLIINGVFKGSYVFTE
ncbi:MAG: CotH kinase family protein, partial [Niabella sp.]